MTNQANIFNNYNFPTLIEKYEPRNDLYELWALLNKPEMSKYVNKDYWNMLDDLDWVEVLKNKPQF